VNVSVTSSAVAAPSTSLATVIRPSSGWSPPRPRELWQYRELLFFLAWRDLKVRYAQTVLGASWTVLQPVAMTFVFVYAFRKLAKVQTGDVPYPVFALAGFVFWTYFAKAVAQGGDSLVMNAQLLTKIYCPRLLIPVAVVLAGLVDLVLGVMFFVVFAAFYGYAPTWRLALLPVFLALALVFTIGFTLLLSALNVRYRDVRQGLPFLINLLLFLSPVVYPIGSRVLAANPLVGTIEGWRWALVGNTPPSSFALGMSVAVSLATFALGVAYFSRVERVFADVA